MYSNFFYLIVHKHLVQVTPGPEYLCIKPHLLLDLSACIHFPLTIATSASRASLMKWFRTLRSQIGLSGDGRLGRVHSNTINSKASSPAITYKKTVTDRLLNIEMEWKLGGLCKEAISSRWGTKFETPLRYLYLCKLTFVCNKLW